MKVTVFYETSEGTMTQWHGKIIKVKPTCITIMRHKQEMHIDFIKSSFVLVTQNFVQDLELNKKDRPSCLANLWNNDLCENNVRLLWLNRKLVVDKHKN